MVYKSVWNPVIDERLSTEREFGNSEDLNAVCVRKGERIIGHVPREFSRIFWHFISHSGTIDGMSGNWKQKTVASATRWAGSSLHVQNERQNDGC